MKTLLIILSLFIASSLQGAYDPNLSKELWRASSAAYLDESKLKGMNCGDACDDLKGYKFSHQFTSPITKNEAVSYSVFYNPDTKKAIFAFRGTDTGKQLAKEALHGGAKTYDLHNIPNAVATNYFYTNYKDHLRNDVLAQAKQLKAKCPDCNFYFTRHSLGGAMTTLGALDVSMSNIVDKKNMHLYTYGSPRVGDVNLAEAVNKHVADNYRVVHDRDLVPHVPPCITNFHGGCVAWKNHINENGLPVFNAYHTGTEVFYNDPKNPNSYKICATPEDPTCSKKYKLINLSVGDHGKYLGIGTQIKPSTQSKIPSIPPLSPAGGKNASHHLIPQVGSGSHGWAGKNHSANNPFRPQTNSTHKPVHSGNQGGSGRNHSSAYVRPQLNITHKPVHSPPSTGRQNRTHTPPHSHVPPHSSGQRNQTYKPVHLPPSSGSSGSGRQNKTYHSPPHHTPTTSYIRPNQSHSSSHSYVKPQQPHQSSTTKPQTPSQTHSQTTKPQTPSYIKPSTPSQTHTQTKPSTSSSTHTQTKPSTSSQTHTQTKPPTHSTPSYIKPSTSSSTHTQTKPSTPTYTKPQTSHSQSSSHSQVKPPTHSTSTVKPQTHYQPPKPQTHYQPPKPQPTYHRPSTTTSYNKPSTPAYRPPSTPVTRPSSSSSSFGSSSSFPKKSTR